MILNGEYSGKVKRELEQLKNKFLEFVYSGKYYAVKYEDDYLYIGHPVPQNPIGYTKECLISNIVDPAIFSAVKELQEAATYQIKEKCNELERILAQ